MADNTRAQPRGSCGHHKSPWDDHERCLSCTKCERDHPCSVCSGWTSDTWEQAALRRQVKETKRRRRATNSVDRMFKSSSEDLSDSSLGSVERPSITLDRSPRSRERERPQGRFRDDRSPSPDRLSSRSLQGDGTGVSPSRETSFPSESVAMDVPFATASDQGNPCSDFSSVTGPRGTVHRTADGGRWRYRSRCRSRYRYRSRCRYRPRCRARYRSPFNGYRTPFNSDGTSLTGPGRHCVFVRSQGDRSLPFTGHHGSPCTVDRSPSTGHRPPFTVHRTRCNGDRTPFTVYRSPYTGHRTPYLRCTGPRTP